MFSYRHAFHAGNHADVLKLTVLVSTVQHLLLKEAALLTVDTHAGAGLYRLDGSHATTSAESAQGIARILAAGEPLAPALAAYVETVRAFNHGQGVRVYPGSPFIVQRMLRAHDRLKLCELHPTDARALERNVAQLEAGRQVTVLREDGFEVVRKFLPPPSRRALVLCDPSYEIKNDYARVQALLQDALRRFPTGVYAIWYPLIPRPEAHDLPRRLKGLAQKADKPWLHAALTVKGGGGQHAGLPASGMFLVNPPYTLEGALREALPQMAALLAQDRHAAWTLESGGA